MQRKCLGYTRNALSTLRLLEEGNIVRSSTTIEIVPNQGAGRPTNLIHFSKSLFYILYSYHLFNLKSYFLITDFYKYLIRCLPKFAIIDFRWIKTTGDAASFCTIKNILPTTDTELAWSRTFATELI